MQPPRNTVDARGGRQQAGGVSPTQALVLDAILAQHGLHPGVGKAQLLLIVDTLGGLFRRMGEGELGLGLGQQAGQEGPAAAGARLVAEAQLAVKRLSHGGSGWAGPVARALGPLHSALAQQQPGSPSPSGYNGPPTPLVVIWAPGGGHGAGAEAGSSLCVAGVGAAEARLAKAQQLHAGEALERLNLIMIAGQSPSAIADPDMPALMVEVHGLLALCAHHAAGGPGLQRAAQLEVGASPSATALPLPRLVAL
jgi:hypothetical protein